MYGIFLHMAFDGRFDEVEKITRRLLEGHGADLEGWLDSIDQRAREEPLWVPFLIGPGMKPQGEEARIFRENSYKIADIVRGILRNVSPSQGMSE